MRKEKPVVECAYGWGQVFRLYHDRLEVNGIRYPLNKLAHVRTVYQRVLGIDSMRLELRFGKKRLLLRGIADMDQGKRAVNYLNACYLGLHSSQVDADVQGHWQASSEQIAHNPAATAEGMQSEAAKPDESSDLAAGAKDAQPPEKKISTAKVAAASWGRFRSEQREQRERRVHIERMLREYGFDVEQLAERLKEDVLPEIAVPLRLLPGEHAHYQADAALCDELEGGPLGSTYPARDHGLLIMTNKRMLFLGRKSQILLDYARLTNITRLRGAMALEARHWYRREIFEVQRPLECTMYLEALRERWRSNAALRPQFRTITGSFFDEQAATVGRASLVDVETHPLTAYSWGMADREHYAGHAYEQM